MHGRLTQDDCWGTMPDTERSSTPWKARMSESIPIATVRLSTLASFRSSSQPVSLNKFPTASRLSRYSNSERGNGKKKNEGYTLFIKQ